ncbi:TPA: ead/Ea22-like family protein [Enterobacter hormaechei subsp. steigerwaltii]|nr:ead/Ea22-like family protein [Enterobacter hormaechei subsp. steigerwaltii]
MHSSEDGEYVKYEDYSALEARCAALVAENAGLKEACGGDGSYRDCPACAHSEYIEAPETPATDAFLAEVRAQAHKEGAHFVANRMLAAWEAGFIDDTAKNAADIARMILSSTEFMADAPEGDFDRSFADDVLEDISAQLRKGVRL